MKVFKKPEINVIDLEANDVITESVCPTYWDDCTVGVKVTHCK